jgi:glycolate oxidase iron-sulfur subunit
MHTQPAAGIADTPLAREARDLLRACVHCGFCLPACPTYRLTGSELDSPRGRIYLVKQMLERGAADATAQAHLDRCLTCRACETACPSGVQYARIADLGREFVERHPPPERRPLRERVLRRALLATAPDAAVFGTIVRIGQALRPLLPGTLARRLPDRAAEGAACAWPPALHARRMAVLAGCVQPALAPQVNAAAARVLDRLGVSLVPAAGAGCCGALDQHLGRTARSLERVTRNVTACARLLDEGCEAIVSTASGCGVHARDYGHLMRDAADTRLRHDAQRVAAATVDLCEALDLAALREALGPAPSAGPTLRVAWQSPCSLQHGQREATAGRVEALLQAVGCELVPVADAALCCGSAGTYSVLQPALSHELRERKLESLQRERPDVIATANIGCHEHLRAASSVPVRHWIEIVDAVLAGVSPLAQPSA